MQKANRTAKTVTARVQAASLNDTDAIEALEKASFQWTPEDVFNRRQIRSLIRNPRAIVRVAVSDGKVLGWAAALIRRHEKMPGENRGGGYSGRVYAIAVHPDAQGLRLGRRLMERLLLELKDRKASPVSLEVDETNAAAIALYRKLGFLEYRRLHHYYGVGRHALKFTRDLDAAG